MHRPISNLRNNSIRTHSPDGVVNNHHNTVVTSKQTVPHHQQQEGTIGSNYSQTTLNNNQTVKINDGSVGLSQSNQTGPTTVPNKKDQKVGNSQSSSYISQENTFTIKMSDANEKEKKLLKKLEQSMRENDNLMNLIKESDAQLARKTQDCENMQSIMEEYVQPLLIKLLEN